MTKPQKLVSPCHGMPVWVFTSGKDEVPVICCPECHNEWDCDGEPIEKEVNGL